MYCKREILGLVSSLSVKLQTFHENSNHLQGGFHVPDNYLRHTHQYSAFDNIRRSPVPKFALMASAAQQVAYFAISVLPATQFDCHSVL